MELFFDGPAGRLEALWWMPSGVPKAAALICHPHPKFGGTMHNTVVFRTARALREAGVAVLRFNFRGVERSEGTHDGLGAEDQDARAALEWLERELPGVPKWGAGFSFGARTISSLATREPRLVRLVLVALPVRVFDVPWIVRIQQPTFLIFGSQDEYGTLPEFKARFPNAPAHFETEQIEGADHFFKYRTPILEERIRAYVERSLDQSALRGARP